MVDQIPENLQARLDWYTKSVKLIRHVNRDLSDVTLRMPTQGKKFELELWGCGVLTYGWALTHDPKQRLATVIIRLELTGSADATSLELHVQKKDSESVLYRGTFTSSIVEIKVEKFDLASEYTVCMAMPTVK